MLNLIKYIEDKSFSKLHNLKFVNLSNNDILNIPRFIFLQYTIYEYDINKK